uniref:hypothetical protein n=1 Tax=Aliarcobacter sp. TaxID=2321116 RepID=UPI004048863B
MKNSNKKEKVIKDSIYYYDVELLKYKVLPYEEVLYKKILLAKKLLKKLVIDENMEDYHRINDVQKAIKFNGKLLLELGYNMADICRKINELIKKEKENV